MAVDRHVSEHGGAQGVARLIEEVNGLIKTIAQPWLTQLVLRFALSVPFWRSGILKWDGFAKLNPVATELFRSEFKLHLPGGPYAFPAPEAMAFITGSAEIVFPILLVLGLATRMAAAGLLVMTAIVELTVPSGWPIHVTWAAMALALMCWGPGPLSLDYVIKRARG
jgi:putative oxidoreductase